MQSHLKSDQQAFEAARVASLRSIAIDQKLPAIHSSPTHNTDIFDDQRRTESILNGAGSSTDRLPPKLAPPSSSPVNNGKGAAGPTISSYPSSSSRSRRKLPFNFTAFRG